MMPFLLPICEAVPTGHQISFRTASPTYYQNRQDDTFSMWWTILNVSKDATVEEIKQAYKKLSLTYHPDAGGDHAVPATADRDKWERLSKAYQEALSNIGATSSV